MTLPRRSSPGEHDEALRRFAAQLSRPPRAPDLADRILDRVGRARPFVSARGRRRVRLLRGAPAAGLLLFLAVVALLQRSDPQRMPVSDAPVVSAVVHAGHVSLATGAAGFADALDAAARRWVTDLVSRGGVRGSTTALAPGVSVLTLEPTPLDRGSNATLAAPGGSGGMDLSSTPRIAGDAPPAAHAWLWALSLHHTPGSDQRPPAGQAREPLR